MTEQYSRFTDAGAEVIAVVHDSATNARAFFERHPIPFPCLLDPDRRVYNRYPVESKAVSLGQRPALFVIDRDGIVRYAHIGWQQWQIPRNDDILQLCHSLSCADQPLR